MGAKADREKTARLGDVLKAGRKLGLEDPGVQDLFQKWIREAQTQVEKAERPIARIKLEITCAELYMELDLMDEAAECFREALYVAHQEGLQGAVQDLERALQTIEAVVPPSKYTLP